MSSMPSQETPVVTSIVWPSASVMYAFFVSGRLPMKPRKRLVLPMVRRVFTAFTLTLNSFSTAALISGFDAFSGTRNVTWPCCEPIVAFSVITGERTMWYIRAWLTFISALAIACLRLLQPRFKVLDRILGQHQRLAPQNVVHVGTLLRQHIHIRDVRGRALEILVDDRAA